MECTLATLLTSACLSWSNLYLDGHISVIDEPVTRYEFDGANWIATPDYQNPYGGYTIGLMIPLEPVKGMSFSIEASHLLSSIEYKDKGINAIGIHARWFPFRK